MKRLLIALLLITPTAFGQRPTERAHNAGAPAESTNVLQKNSGGGATFSTAIDFKPKGPNPYIDARAYGVRAVSANVAPAIPGITATISSASNIAVISSASTFQDGDGVVIWGAGATNTMSTPGAPTVVPSVSASETGSLLDVAAPAGSTTYCYSIVARDVMGGLTAASTETCTTTGAVTLGMRTNSVSSITMSNDIVTVTTTAPHGLAVGALISIAGVSVANVAAVPGVKNPYNGWFIVATAADRTHFTYWTNADTRADSPASGLSGTVTYWQNNHITWSAVTGAFEFYIYGRVTGESKTLIGVSWPQDLHVSGDTTYLAFDDFGSPVTAAPTVPAYVPTNPPTAATNDILATTISSGAGTTTLTLADAATNSATGATILLDDAVNFLAAANAANSAGTSVMFPVNDGTYYVLNSPITIPGGTSVLQKGAVYLNETMTISGVSWVGVVEKGTSPSFAYSPGVPMTINRANPGIFTIGNANLYNLTLNNLGANGANMVVMDAYSAIPAGTLEDINFVLNSGTDYSNMAFVSRGTHTNAGAVWNLKNILLLTSQNGSLTACTPAMYFNNGANPKFYNLFMSGKGILLRPTVSGSYLEADTVYTQANYEPLFAFTNALGGGNASVSTMIKNVTLDTTSAPTVANLGGMAMAIQMEYAGEVTGVPTMSISGVESGRRLSTGVEMGTTNASSVDGIFSRTSVFSVKSLKSSLSLGTGYSIFTNGTTPEAPSCPVGAGGSVPVNTYIYFYAPIFANGSEGKFSLPCSATTSAGNRTVSLSWTAVPGATAYNLYRGTSANYTVLLNCSNPNTTTNSYTDTAGSACGQSAPNTAAGGPAGMRNGLIWGNIHAIGTSTSAPTAFAGVNVFDLATDNWPAFNVNGGNKYFLASRLSSTSVTNGDCVTWVGTGATATLGDAGTACSSGGGTPGGSTDALQYNNAGSLAGLNSPTTNGLYNIVYNVTANAAVPPTALQVGLGGRTITGATTTDTITYSDNVTVIDHDVSASAAANQTLPTAITLGNPNFVYSYMNRSASTDTITPTTWTIQKNTAAAASSATVRPGESCRIKNDPNSATNWLMDCTPFKAKGTVTLGTSSISSGTCATVVTVAAAGVLTTDTVTASFNGDPTGITGYLPSTSGSLYIYAYPTAGNVNFKVCNNTSGAITPGAVTLNWTAQ